VCRRFGGRSGRGFAVEGEVLGFVALDGAEEGVVVGGALSGTCLKRKWMWREAVMVGPFAEYWEAKVA